MAFDHNEIVLEAQLFLKNNISAVIAKQFLPDKFPLNRLQDVYEAILGEKYDNRNFRKKMIHDGVVEETGDYLKTARTGLHAFIILRNSASGLPKIG